MTNGLCWGRPAKIILKWSTATGMSEPILVPVTGIQHRIRITQLADNLLGVVTFSSLVHQKFSSPKGR